MSSSDVQSTAQMYIVARLLLGFGIPFCIIGGSSLMGELAYPKERAVMTSLFNALWFVGSLIAAGVSFGTQVSYPLDYLFNCAWLIFMLTLRSQPR